MWVAYVFTTGGGYATGRDHGEKMVLVFVFYPGILTLCVPLILINHETKENIWQK